MATPVSALWGLVLLLVAWTALAAGVAAAEGPVVAPFVDDSIDVDGVLEDPLWAHARSHALVFDGTLRPEATRDVDLRLAHNGTHLLVSLTFTPGGGTHEGDFVVLTFDQDGADEKGSVPDLMRYGWPDDASLLDRSWNGTAWQDDEDVACRVDGAAARVDADGVWIYELVKPLHGDACDLRTAPGSTVGFRVEVRENMPAPNHGDNHRWPAGTTYLQGDTHGWGALQIAAMKDAGAGDPEVGSGDVDDPASDPEGSGAGGSERRDGSGDRQMSGDRQGSGDQGPSNDSAEAPVPHLGALLAVLATSWAAGRMRRGPRRS